MKKVLFFLLFATISAGIVFGWRIWRVQQLAREKFTPQPMALHLDPPKEALSLIPTQVSGTVQKNARDHEEPIPVEINQPLLQGETITTAKDGKVDATMQKPNSLALHATIFPDTKLSLSDALPTELLFTQSSGKVLYDTDLYISVRLSRTLLTFPGGIAQISIDPDRKIIKVAVIKQNSHQSDAGGKISFVDKKNETVSWMVNNGSSAIINEQTGIVTVE